MARKGSGCVFPEEAGFWSVTKAEDVHAVSRGRETFSSELGGVTVFAEIFPLELARAMFIGMDPPKHDRAKALFVNQLKTLYRGEVGRMRSGGSVARRNALSCV